MSLNSAALATRLVVAAEPQVGLHLPRRAAGGGDQALGVGLQQLAVGARLVEVALQRAARAQPEEVVHPLGGLRPQRHVGEGAAAGDVVPAAVAPADALALAAVGLGGDVGLEADDRLHAGPLGRLVELVGAEEVAVVGHRDRRHAHLGRALEQVADARGAVEHRVLGVDVEVDEGVAPDPEVRRSRAGGVEPVPAAVLSGMFSIDLHLAALPCPAAARARPRRAVRRATGKRLQ